MVADQPQAALGVEPRAVEGDDAGGLLPAMLERMQPERDDRGGVRMAEYAEDAAFLAQPVVVEVELGAAPSASGWTMPASLGRRASPLGRRRERRRAGTFLLISASSFCLSSERESPGRRVGSRLLRRARARRASRAARRQSVRRLAAARLAGGSLASAFVARLDPAVDRRRRVLGQHRDDPVGGLGQDGPRPGVLDPFRLLLLGDQPIEDRESDDRKQETRAPRRTRSRASGRARRSCCREWRRKGGP